ncbi:MAG: hypothetical protein PHR20_06455 [Bacteroidales bacterium]|nr:hypothetical protein [Bacteroidales bacterium]
MNFINHSKFIYLLPLFAVITISCKNDSFNYPDSKIWAHRVNDTITAQEKENLFAGVEVDIFISPFQDKIFVGHDDNDTINGLELYQWFSAIQHPQKLRYWLDVKNLYVNNAEMLSGKINDIICHYGLQKKLIIESPNGEALKTVKQHGIPVLLWVDNIHDLKTMDTAYWYERTKGRIGDLEPDAISCNFRMFPLLTDSFPEQKIHFWHTPADYTPENVELTKRICANKSVKVVLVDYETPDL